MTTPTETRLPLIVGFQPVADSVASKNRIVTSGRGIYVYDSNGNEFIESASGFFVASLGFGNEEVTQAMVEQSRTLPFCVSAEHQASAISIELAAKLAELVPIHGAHVVFGSTGSEANDFLLKLLRLRSVADGRTERTIALGRWGSYHGGTIATASLTGVHHPDFGLPIEGFGHVGQPDYHGSRHAGESAAEFARRRADQLDRTIDRLGTDRVAVLFAEPVSFSAGLAVPPPEYFPLVGEVASAHAIDLVADEIITGFGRGGGWFASPQVGFEPNHVTMAKGITGGYFPLSAIALGPELYADLDRASAELGTLFHASTYAANPIGAATALTVIKIIERDHLNDHAADMGRRLAAGFRTLATHPLVGDVRSFGLAAAIDFLRRNDDDEVVNDDAPVVAARVVEALAQRGVIARQLGRSVMMCPPLIIQPAEIDELCRRLAASLDAVAAVPE